MIRYSEKIGIVPELSPVRMYEDWEPDDESGSAPETSLPPRFALSWSQRDFFTVDCSKGMTHQPASIFIGSSSSSRFCRISRNQAVYDTTEP